MTFTPRQDDVYVASYPRSGTTWMQMILHVLRGGPDAPTFDHISDVAPYFEVSLQAGQNLDLLASPRILKTHLPRRVVGNNPGKFIYVERDGRDVLVSYFHFYRDYYKSELTFPQFFDQFMDGKLRYGSWFRHVADWRAHNDSEKIQYVAYEDLINQLTPTIERLAGFLSWPNPAQLQSVLENRCSFNAMKGAEERFAPLEARDQTSAQAAGKFLRSGQIGGWKASLTPEQIDRFNQMRGA